MRELREPTLTSGGFGDSRDTRKAVGELLDISRMRSQAHAAANLFRDYHFFRDYRMEVGSAVERDLRGKLQGAEGVLARWAIMAAHQEFRTVDLARVENNGDWNATAEAEKGIGDLAVELFMAGEIDGLVERDTPKAKLRITVDPGLLSEDGLIAIRRKRLMIATAPTAHVFTDMRPAGDWDGHGPRRGHATVADMHLEVDKVSEFVMDFDRLNELDSEAATAIRRVAQYGPAEITSELEDATAAVEAAIIERDAVLSPAVTTYYADRKYKNVRRLDQADREMAGA